MYEKTIWKDQIVEFPRRREIIKNGDGTHEILDAYGEVTELGTLVNAERLNKIENGIQGCAIRRYKADEPYKENEIIVVEEDKPIFFKSLVNDNKNNSLEDTDYWSKTNLGFGWGNIQGSISEQTDLQESLNDKLDIDISNLSQSGKNAMSAFGMPNTYYIAYSNSTTSLVAPCNGWLKVQGQVNGTSGAGFGTAVNHTLGVYNSEQFYYPSNNTSGVTIPFLWANSGDSLGIQTSKMTLNLVRFYPAQGLNYGT